MLANENLLRQKLSIAALIEVACCTTTSSRLGCFASDAASFLTQLIFRRKAEDRVIAFKDIAAGTSLGVEQVELLLIKALSLKVIRGTIDEVDQVVQITWAIPHALDMDQIAVMKDNLGAWRTKTETTMQFVEDQSPELFT